jgi:acetyl-CoA carboxylase biotin carboxylase subunit
LSEVSIYYDPLIAKLAVWGRTRDEAIARLRRALDEYQVSGITTTLPFFREVVGDEEFVAGRLDTGFIARFNERRVDSGEPPQEEADLAAVAAAIHYVRHQQPVFVQTGAQGDGRWKMAARAAGLRRWRKS